MGRIGPGSGSIPTAHQTTLAMTRNTNKAIKSCTIEFPFKRKVLVAENVEQQGDKADQ